MNEIMDFNNDTSLPYREIEIDIDADGVVEQFKIWLNKAKLSMYIFLLRTRIRIFPIK